MRPPRYVVRVTLPDGSLFELDLGSSLVPDVAMELALAMAVGLRLKGFLVTVVQVNQEEILL